MSACLDGEVTESERKVTYDFIDENINKDVVFEFMNLFEDYTTVALEAGLKTSNIAKHINQELNQQQKIIVIFHLLELVSADGKIQEKENEFVDKLASEFNLDIHEYKIIKAFVTDDEILQLGLPNVLVVSGQTYQEPINFLHIPDLDGEFGILRIPSLEMYMLKYFSGRVYATLNGVPLKDRHIYTFSNGASIRSEKINPIYYSDVVSRFLQEGQTSKISFEAQHIYYAFSGGKIALRDVNISEESGKLIGLMGASGSGKSTLLNVLNGNAVPVGGRVLINGVNIHDTEEKKQIEGVIGYVPQDDLLIEDLTVYQNLYYAAKLCFKNANEEEIEELVDKTLSSLGLSDTRNLKVGNPLQKTISGGQRKRLNIGLELLREPAVLFCDEPTSGLSSKDSENIMDLLKELTLKGKLIFVVIHQPSSDIFKMFDKLVILDVGGYQIYYGNPIEAVSYFREMENLMSGIDAVCPTCGNVNTEQIFNIIETELVDEYGRYTNERKVSPVQWAKAYEDNILLPKITPVKEPPARSLNVPSRLKQFLIFATRDLKAKFSNNQYMTIALLEAPLLAFILSYIVRYYHIDDSLSENVYSFAENVNIPAYIFMSIIVALFVGLTVSAEEIIKDAKIRKREIFLHLSRGSYLTSKILILFGFSAIQTASFVLIGNFILGIEGMHLTYWLVLFSTSCFANMLGLNISATFDSVITIYILIPILIIPQLILGGIVVKFDDVNPHLASHNKVPIVSELMAARWAFEALAVSQFKDNPYEDEFYELDKQMAMADYKKVYYIPMLESKATYIQKHLKSIDAEVQVIVDKDLELLNNEIQKELLITPQIPFSEVSLINRGGMGLELETALKEYLGKVKKHYIRQYNRADKAKNRIIAEYVKTEEGKKAYLAKIRRYHNERIAELVKNSQEENRIVEYDGELIQKIYPVFEEPELSQVSWHEFRIHFFAPKKHIAGLKIDTLWFNILIIWSMTFILYYTLYYKAFRITLSVFSSILSRRKRK